MNKVDVPIDFLKAIDSYRPKSYTASQLSLLSSKAKFVYMEKVTTYNDWCDAIGLPEKKVILKEV